MSLTTLQRLLKYPHAAVFDKDPGAELVFRLQHANGSSWRISGGVLTATAGAAEFSYALADFTVAGAIAALRADGFNVVHVSAEFDTHSALVLVDGEGSETVSNGDHIHAFTSLLWALLSGYAREVDAAAFQVRQALLQMVILTAEGEWLDLWGALYGVGRLDGETDVAYRVRIPKEAFRIRVNARAIELAIKELTGKNVRILESWETVFTLDQSELSGADRIQDGERVGPFYIQPMSETSIDWSDVLPIVLRNKPAGVLMLPPQVNHSTIVLVPNDWTVSTAITRIHTATVRLEDMALLDFMDIEDVSTPNYPMDHRRSILRGTLVEIGGIPWPPAPWMPLPWNQINYAVLTDRSRSYRVHETLVTYEGQYWLRTPWLPLAWEDINVLVSTSHSRTS